MPKRMLIDATHAEETRVAVIDQNLRLENLDIVHEGREPLKGNIYLAKVKRIEPSLQAAFVEYGGNRHGFLPFAEIHPDYFRIPIADREALMKRIADAEARLEAGEDPLKHINLGDGDQPPLASHDPFQPISFDSADTGSSLINLMDQPVAAAPAIALDDEGDDEDEDGDNSEVPDDEEAAEARAASSNYETVGGDDEMGEMRRRIRRQFLRNYRIQEVIKRGQVMLIQVVKEERGNKGAALTSYMSLAGRYCVLMPNSDKSGGVSRKISNVGDRRRLKEIIDSLSVPDGMSVILRTAGVERTNEEIARDFDYLVRLWDQIRDTTMKSTAPALIYEEANLIKRAIRDYFARDTDAIVVEGNAGYTLARDFMRLLMPSHESRVIEYTDPNLSLFARYQIEGQIERLYQPVVQLKSGGYIVINPTEALISIDVNSGRATRDRHIEETALRTNLEASDEIARQLRLRDLAGLVVIDYIDMEDYKHNHQVERRLKEAMRHDRARLQIGRISPFGLMELSRQRLRPSLLETNYEKCTHCGGAGHVRSTDSAALSVIRAIAQEGVKQKAVELAVFVPTVIATYILNHKRTVLEGLESRFGLKVFFKNDDKLAIDEYRIERQKAREGEPLMRVVESHPSKVFYEHAAELGIAPLADADLAAPPPVNLDGGESDEAEGNTRRERGGRARDRGRRERGPRPSRTAHRAPETQPEQAPANDDTAGNGNAATVNTDAPANGDVAAGQAERERRRRRGRRGGRNRTGNREPRPANGTVDTGAAKPAPAVAPLPQGSRDQAGYAAAYAPKSVHEIDTTPKDTKPAASDSSEKKGWWRRWTS